MTGFTARRGLTVALCAALLVAGLPPDSLAKSRKPARARSASHSPPKPVTPAGPESVLPNTRLYGAALLFNAEDGSILFARNIYGEFPPASLAKLMLALIVIEDLRAGRVTLSHPIPVSAAAARTNGSHVYLRKDEVFTLDDMMGAALVRSANNACVAIAEGLDGSVAAFVERMNGWARALGMRQTTFRSPHGLPQPPGEPSDSTTAFDMAILARRMVQYPEIFRWTSLKTTAFRGGKLQIRTTNRLLDRIPGLDGLKTGYTRSAGFHLVATGERNAVRIVSVVLGSDTSTQRFQASEQLIRLGFASLGCPAPGENLPAALPDPETMALLSSRTSESGTELTPTQFAGASSADPVEQPSPVH